VLDVCALTQPHRTAVAAAAAQDEWTPPPGWSTAPGGANSSGLGFCVCQLAQAPEQSVGTSSAGEAINQVATSGPGALPDTLEGARYSACGGPGPGVSSAGSPRGRFECPHVMLTDLLTGPAERHRDEAVQAGTTSRRSSC
jgi:hypothetical protein